MNTPFVLKDRNPAPQQSFYQQPAGEPQDLYPTLTQYTISPKTAGVMRQQGMNPTALQKQFELAHGSGDYATKAKLANQFAQIEDTVGGGNAAANFLESHRLRTEQEAAPVYGSTGTAQSFYGNVVNGLVDMVEAVPQLLVAGAGFTHAIDKDRWAQSQKGIENYFTGWKTYVSEDWQKPLASYDDADGLQFDLNFKSLLGTTSNLLSYVLPGLATLGVGSVVTAGARKAAVTGVTALARAEALSTLGKAATTIKYATGTEAFLQTFPMYQREGLAAGLDIHDATMWALPVAGINAVIETANVGALAKSMGISASAGRAAIREASLQEASRALLNLPEGFTAQMLLDAGQAGSRAALGVIARPSELGAMGRLVSNIGGRVKRGFLGQGLTEGGEEVLQSIVENASKELYNNIASSDTTGRFKDPSFGKYAFDAIYGGTLGAVMGTATGSFTSSRQADPTVFSYVAANVRDGLRKGYSLDDMLNPDPANPARLKMLGVLDNKRERGVDADGIDDATHADMVSKVSRMAGIANDFSDVDAYTEADRQNMFSISEAKHKSGQTLNTIADQRAQLQQLDQAVADPNLSTGEQIKAQIERGKLVQQLGGQVADANGNVAYEAESRAKAHQSVIDTTVAEAMNLYANDTARPAINAYVSDKLAVAERDYGQTQYPDPFKPQKQVTDYVNNRQYVTDGSKLVFRELVTTGGRVTTPAGVDASGQYVPAVREDVAQSYAQPAESVDTHLSLVNGLADPANPLTPRDYRQPDNSVERKLLMDGADIIANIQQLTQGKKKKDLAAAKALGAAYLAGTQGLATDAKYGAEYQAVVDALTPLVADALPQQTADTAQTVGDDVDLLAEGTSVDTASVAPPTTGLDFPVIPDDYVFTGNLTPQTNATTTNPTPISNQPLQPTDVEQSVEQPQTPESELADGLQRAAVEEQRDAAGAELSQRLDLAGQSLAAAESDTNGATGRAADALDELSRAFESELATNGEPVAAESADPRTTGPESADPRRTLKPTDPKVSPASFAKSFTPVDQQSAILAYFAGRRKINQADFDRMAGANTRKGERGGNPYFNYLDGTNRQPPLDTIGRSLADSLGLTEYDQQAWEQAIVDTVVGFSRGNGPSVQLQNRYAEQSGQADSGADAAAELSLDSLTQTEQEIVYTTPGLADELTAQTDALVNSFTDEEAGLVERALVEGGYILADGTFDADTFNADKSAFRSGLLEFDPAGLDLYEKFLESIIFSQSEIQSILYGAYQRADTDRQTNTAETDNQDGTTNPADQSDSGRNPTPIGRPSDTIAVRADAIRNENASPERAGRTGLTDAEINAITTQFGFPPYVKAPGELARRFDAAGVTDEQAQAFLAANKGGVVYDLAGVRQAFPALPAADAQFLTEYFQDSGDFEPIVRAALAIRQAQQQALTPKFSLAPETGQVAQSGTPVGRLAERLAATFGVEIVTDQAQIDEAFARAVEQNPSLAGRTALGFRSGNRFYLPEGASLETTLHEFGGLMVTLMRNADPQLFQRGLALIRESRYLGQIQRDSVYGRLSVEEQEMEALETAIGNLGSQYAIESNRSRFRQWLDTAWAKIKSVLGINNPKPITDFTLNDFVGEVVGQMLSGNVQTGEGLNEGVQFQVTPYTNFTYKGNAYQFKRTEDKAGNQQEQYFKNGQPIDRTTYESDLRRADILSQRSIPYTIQQTDVLNKDALRGFVKELTTRLPDKVYDESAFNSAFSEVVGDAPQLFGKEADYFSRSLAWDTVRNIYGRLPDGSRADILQWENSVTQFQLKPQPVPLTSLRQQAVDELTKTPNGVQSGLLNRSPRTLTKIDKAYIAAVAARTGFSLENGKLSWTPLPGFFHGTNGSAIQLDPADVAATLEEGYGSGHNAAGNRGILFQQMADKLKANTNLESFIHLADDAGGSLRALIIDPMREDARDGDYVDNELQGREQDVKELLAPFSEQSGNTIETVKTVIVKSYDYNASGNLIEVERVLPIAVAMRFVGSTLTQYTSHGRASGVAETPPNVDKLYTRETNGRLTRNVYGEMYEDSTTKEVYHLLLSKAESDKLVNRFRNGVGAYDGEVEAFAALHDFFNQESVVSILEDRASQLNPAENFQRIVTQNGEPNYSPITPAGSATDARAESRDQKKTLDETRQLLSRTAAPNATVLQDPISVMRNYRNSVSDVISYGRTVANLSQLRNTLDKYQGPNKTQLDTTLKNQISKVQNYRQNLARQRTEGGTALIVVDTIMRKYGRAALNSLGSPIKQAVTFGSAMASKFIDAKYLMDSQALSLLSNLTAAAYRDVTARGDLDIAGRSSRGLEGIGGYSTAERPLIEKLLGTDIQDADAREKHRRRWATVIGRLISGSNQFVDGAQFEDFGLSSKNLTNVQKKLRQADAWADKYLTTMNQRVDRATVFAWMKSAELSGIDRGLTGDALDDYMAKTTTSLLFENYSMSNLFHRTPLSLSDNFLYKMLGLYSAQAQQQGNLLLRAVADWAKAQPGSPEATAALRQLYKTGTWVIAFNAVGVSVVSGVARALLAALSGDPVPEELGTQVVYDSLKNVVGVFPGLASSMTTYLISTNDTINSGGNDQVVDFPAVEVLAQGLDALRNGGMALFNEDERKAENALDSLLRDFPDMAAKGLGIPLNLKKIAYESLTVDDDDK